MKDLRFIAGLLMLAIFLGCGRQQEDTTSIREIQEQEGVPVVVEEVKFDTMIVTKRYSGTIRGEQEATASSGIGGNVERILVRVGQFVHKDQVLAQFRDDAPASQYRQAKAAYENSKKNLERFEELFKAGAISRQQLDEIRTMHDVNKANFEAAETQIFVKAPISGYIGHIYVEEGDGVRFEAPIASITDLKQMSIRVNIPESDIRFITRDNSVKIISGDGEEFDAEITKVSLTANQMTRDFEIVVKAENPEMALRSGLIVDVEIALVEKPDAISTIREVVRTDSEGKDFVFVVSDNIARRRDIETGLRFGIDFEIVEGLSEGDLLVVEGASLLQDGSLVKIVEKR